MECRSSLRRSLIRWATVNNQPEQGEGDGNLTFVRAHVGEAGALRDTEYTYDFRNRLIKA